MELYPHRGMPTVLGVGLESCFSEPLRGPSRPKGVCALRRVSGQAAGVLVGTGLSHQAPAPQCFPQTGVVQRTGGFQPDEQHLLLRRAHP